MKHFDRKEFYCQCGCGLCFDDMDKDMVRALDRARGIAKVPFKINSSIRCEARNRRVGGSIKSSHLLGLAVDIGCVESYSRLRILHGLKEAGFSRIGIRRDFIHADQDMVKPKGVLWVY